MAKIQKAALQTPTVAGYRVLPEMTPGRAMLWGSILAIWGTAALVSAAARSLDIRGAEDAPAKLKAVFDPVAQFLKSNLAPLKGSMSVAAATHGEDIRAETAQSVFVQGLKDRLMAH